MKKIRMGIILLCGIIWMSLFIGCGEDKLEEKNIEKEVLTMMLNGSVADAYVEGYQKIIDRFNEENTYGVIIEPEFVSNSDYKTKLTTMMVSDSQPDIVYTWELAYLDNFVNGGKIVNLQEYLDADIEWKESFNKGILEQETYNGNVYGIPTAQCMAVMYYNKAIFEKYDLQIPTTYDEYCMVCDTLIENGITPVALAATSDDAWLVSQYIQQLSNGISGYELFNGIKNGKRKWNDPSMIEAAELFQREIEKGYFEEGFINISGSDAEKLFQMGQTAMYFNGSWETSNLDDPIKCQEVANIGCFTMPAVDIKYANVSVGSLDNSFAITTNCENVEAAIGFLKYWTSKENASMLLYEYGRIPATSIDLDENKLSSLSKDVIMCFKTQEALTPWFDRMNTDLGNEFNNCCIEITNGANAKEVLNNLQNYTQEFVLEEKYEVINSR